MELVFLIERKNKTFQVPVPIRASEQNADEKTLDTTGDAFSYSYSRINGQGHEICHRANDYVRP